MPKIAISDFQWTSKCDNIRGTGIIISLKRDEIARGILLYVIHYYSYSQLKTVCFLAHPVYVRACVCLTVCDKISLTNRSYLIFIRIRHFDSCTCISPA